MYFTQSVRYAIKARSNERNMLHATSSNIVACNMLHRLNTLLYDVAWCWMMLHEVLFGSNFIQHHATGCSNYATCCTQQWVGNTLWGDAELALGPRQRPFESQVFQHMATMLEVNKTRTTPYHPESNGMVERINRTLKDMLSKVVNDNQDDWDTRLPQVLLAYRSTCQLVSPPTVCSSGGRLACQLTRSSVTTGAFHSPSHNLCKAWKRDSMRHMSWPGRSWVRPPEDTRTTTLYDARSTGNPFKVGDRVWRHVSYVKRGLTRKLARPWHGPYVIIKKLSDVVYHIKKEDGRKRLVVHFNSLKPRFTPKEVPEATGSDPNGGCSKGRQAGSGTAVSDREERMWFLAQPNSACRPPPEPNVNPKPASEPVEQNSADPSSSSALPMTAAPAGSDAGGEAAVPCTAQAPVECQASPRPSRVKKPPVWTKDYQLDL